MASEGRTPLLQKARWLLLKREEHLRKEQRFRLRDLLRYNLKTSRLTFSRRRLNNSGTTNSPSWAGTFLDEWRRHTMRS
jgi:transposase